MKDYQAIELPNISDPKIIRTMVSVQKILITLHDFHMHVIKQHSYKPFTANTIVFFVIIPRILEGARSVMLLCQKNFARDAGILLINIHELRLDLEYIGISNERADVWLNHTKDNRKPWKVSDQIKELSEDKKEEDAMFSAYRYYSMAKHGNPVGKNLSFPISKLEKDVYQINRVQNNDPLIHHYMFGLGIEIKNVGMAAIRSYDNSGFDVNCFADNFNKHWETLSKYSTDHITTVLKEFVVVPH